MKNQKPWPLARCPEFWLDRPEQRDDALAVKKNRWQLQEAKNHLSQVVENALANQPQVITRHGKEAVVVVSFSEWKKHAPSRKKLVDVLRDCPTPDYQIPRDRDTPWEVEV